MTKVSVYNLEGKKTGEMELAGSVFAVPVNNALLHQVYVSQAANRRQVLAHAKDRSETAGSGKKPWAQKGTGRARTGAARNPIWRGGGTIFGPTKNRNFKRIIPLKMKRKALLMALSGKVKTGNIILVENLKLKTGKTKEFAAILARLKIKGSMLVGLGASEKGVYLCARNIPKINLVATELLNVFDILNHKYLLLSKESVKYLENKYNSATNNNSQK